MIVGTQQQGIAVADLIAARDDGAKLLPRLLTDGSYMLPDAATTDPETAAAHSLLAGWSTQTVSNFADADIVNSPNTRTRLFVKIGADYYWQTGGRGDVLTMPATNVFRFKSKTQDGLEIDLHEQGYDGRRRSELARLDDTALLSSGVTPNPRIGDTTWNSFCVIMGDVPSYRSSLYAGASITQWHTFETSTGGPCFSVDVAGDQLFVITRSSAQRYSNSDSGIPQTRYTMPLPAKGVKTYIVAKLTWGASGHATVWINGSQVYDADIPLGTYHARTGWTTADPVAYGPIFGQYADTSPNTDIVYHANFEWALNDNSNSLLARVANPLSVPDLSW